MARRPVQTKRKRPAARRSLSGPGIRTPLHLLAIMALAFGKLDLAVAPRPPGLPVAARAGSLFQRPRRTCRRRGLLAEGEQAARRAVALDPNEPGAWNNLGIILQEMLELDESRRCLERVLSFEPHNAGAQQSRQHAKAHRASPPRPRSSGRRRWRSGPNYAEVYSNLANLLNDQGHYDRAEAIGAARLEINPRLVDAYVNLSAIETARHRHAGALRSLEALLAFVPAIAGPRRQGARAETISTGSTRRSRGKPRRRCRAGEPGGSQRARVRSCRRWADSRRRSRPTTRLRRCPVPRARRDRQPGRAVRRVWPQGEAKARRSTRRSKDSRIPP